MFNKEKFLSRLSSKPKSFFQLVRELNIPRNKNRNFSIFISQLEKDGDIMSNAKREYFKPNWDENTSKGIIRLNPSGFGFVDIEEDEKSYFISPNSVNNAMDGDEVTIKTFTDPLDESKFQGLVTKINQRNTKTFVGEVSSFNGRKIINPIDPKIKGKFDLLCANELKDGTLVKVEISKYGRFSKCQVTKNLGHKDEASIDILSLIEDADIPIEFPKEVIKDANALPSEVLPKDIEGREDFRKRLIVTIDGDDTKDFDDAIEVYKDGENFVLGIHIADVTHYVKEDSMIDKEARKRGTSIYLADRVIPMLPEKLSNGICSLNPKVDRLTLSAIITIDKNGNTIDYKLVPGVINSKHRLTYKEVNNYYKGIKTFDKPLSKMLDEAKVLTDIIRKYKIKEGYIDFEIEESKLIIDEKGNTIDIVAKERGESEMMIEDFMVRANETVAKHGASNKVPFLYRIHEKPDIDRINNLQRVISVLNIGVKVPEQPSPLQFARAVEQIKETRFDDFIKVMMLRTMSKAIYSENNVGHFGLASEFYTHFTSPIRRYPDLIVHRMIREYFFKNHLNLKDHFSSILPEIAAHSSKTEQLAVDLERKVADIKKAEFYEKFVGETFKGTINSITKFGFFVEFPNKVDGLVHNSTLVGNWETKKDGLVLTNGIDSYTIGDTVEVVVVKAEKASGKIDLVLSKYYKEFIENNKLR